MVLAKINQVSIDRMILLPTILLDLGCRKAQQLDLFRFNVDFCHMLQLGLERGSPGRAQSLLDVSLMSALFNLGKKPKRDDSVRPVVTYRHVLTPQAMTVM